MSEKKLRFKFSGRVIDHLGIQMYQSPVAAISELVANAWDSDAEEVRIELPAAISDDAEIVVKDDGLGMTFEQCDERFLSLGYARRGANSTERSPEKNRSILGRKGIGKLAGFGIARLIRVETVSKSSGERTVFEMDVDELRSGDYVNMGGAPIDVVEYQPPDESRKAKRGTKITLKNLSLNRRPSPATFARSMARRFLLHQAGADFQVLVNGSALPEDDALLPVYLSFPEAYRDRERPEGLLFDDDWGREQVGAHEIKWRVRFFKETIKESELRGVSVYAGIKMVQSPFFFDLSGGVSGQHGQQYISGQIQADFIDEQREDHIAPERQRVNWTHPEIEPLQEWGRSRLRTLLRIWANRTGEDKTRMFMDSGVFWPRLKNLPKHERDTLLRALNRMGEIQSLTQPAFEEIGNAMLQAWEHGRLKDLIADISATETLDANQLVALLVEADVLTSLNIGESVKTKLATVIALSERIESRDLENAVRDYISKHPWIVSPEWETFAVERSMKTILDEAAKDARFTPKHLDDLKGRVDLALSSGDHLLILEFMRPRLTLDWDHVTRFKQYVRMVDDNLRYNTAGRFNRVTGYIIADAITKQRGMPREIESMSRENMFVLDWANLLSRAISQWKDSLAILAERNPDDERIKTLLGE